MKKYYRIADLTVAMDSYGTIEKQSIAYEVPESTREDITISSYKDDVKNLIPQISDDMAEYLGTGVDFYIKLLKYDGLMLHSSAVVVDEKAYLFSADCGTGKSTHTRLWLDMFGDNAYILNDDKPALRIVDGKWYAYGTPWSGKHDISVNKRVPLAGIAIVQRSETNKIERWNGKEAIFELFKQVNRPRGQEYRIKLLSLLDKLITQVPIWKLECNMDPEAAKVSYEAMSGRMKNNEKQ